MNERGPHASLHRETPQADRDWIFEAHRMCYEDGRRHVHKTPFAHYHLRDSWQKLLVDVSLCKDRHE
jgi:hypothetical protein